MTCLHCGTQFSAHAATDFCCTGCEFVHKLLHERDLGHYYRLRGETLGVPVHTRPFEPLDLSWLEEAAEGAEATAKDRGTTASMSQQVHGITCLGCVWLVEKIYLQMPGAIAVDIHPEAGQARFFWRAKEFDFPHFARQLQQFGYLLSPPDSSAASPDLGLRLAICGGLALNTMAFSLPRYFGMEENFELAPLMDLIAMGSATLSLVVGGSHFFARAWQALRLHTLHLDFPISLGLLAAWIGSLYGWATGRVDLLYFDFVSNFTFLMLGGRHLHQIATRRALRRMRLQAPIPESYLASSGPGETRVRTTEITSGMRLIVPPNGPVPVAGLLHGAPVACSLAWINGEPEPVTYWPGQRVPAGAINLHSSPLELVADEAWQDSLPARLTAPVEGGGRSPLLERLIRIYLAAVLLISLGAGVWWFARSDPGSTLQVVISILVISCPCALGTAIPLLDQRAATSLQRLGVFVRNHGVWEKLPRIRLLLLDKTGTLTLQHPVLQNPGALEGLSAENREILRLLTLPSLHPLARSLHQEICTRFPEWEREKVSLNVVETPGEGLSAHADGHRYALGKGPAGQRNKRGMSTIFSRDEKILTCFEFSESLRPGTREMLRSLGNLEPHILSGDAQAAVNAIAAQLGIPEQHARGGLDPDAKARLTSELSRAAPALYLGDGANDALAFRDAALTAAPATDRSLLEHQADILFTSTGLDFLPAVFAASRWRSHTARGIFLFAVAYNSAAIALCLAGKMNPLLAAILMPASSLVTLAIAARPLPGGRTPERRLPEVQLTPSWADGR